MFDTPYHRIVVAYEPWQVMISLALAIYAASKAATWWSARHRLGAWPSVGYLLGWPGMDPRPFFARTCRRKPTTRDAAAGLFMLATGAGLMAYSTILSPLAAGVSGMLGFVLALHFGLFQLLALIWQGVGFDVRPIMNGPQNATSLSDFWSRRWNLAFRDLAHRLVFKPLLAHTEPVVAVLGVFVVSGIVHDLVISVPAGAGYGLPTVYFLVQAMGFLLQRTQICRRIGLASGRLGWATTAMIVLFPVQLLFHEAFLIRVMSPFVAAIHAAILT